MLSRLGFEGWFDPMITCDDVTRAKPAPDCYALAIERLGVEASECVVVEDSLHGIQAARAAGAGVVRGGHLGAARTDRRRAGHLSFHRGGAAVAAEMTRIRAAGHGDLPRILSIYNHEVLVSTATYDTVPRTEAEHRNWFGIHGADHPVLVAESGGEVAGWASLSPWSDRAAYSRTVEVSVYVDEEHREKGIGRQLLQALVDAGRTHGHHALLARISADNEASIRLHADLGFSVVGTMHEVGTKFGRMLDVCIMELLI